MSEYCGWLALHFVQIVQMVEVWLKNNLVYVADTQTITQPRSQDADLLTMNHLVNSIFAVLAQINDTGICFAKLVAASAVEEAAPRAYDGSMDSPPPVIANNGQIGVFSAQMKPVVIISKVLMV